MKIILSRKGFDSKYGGIPSPILPDRKTLLSMPIPSDDGTLSYKDLHYDGITYHEILRQLAPKKKYDICHLDPDIRAEVRISPIEKWDAAFGQIGSPQGFLRNNQIQKGDLFLFFGRFRQTIGNMNEGTLRYEKHAPILHIIFGYLEIGRVVNNDNLCEVGDMNCSWHPHGAGKRLKDKSNTLYLAADTLSFDMKQRGWGSFSYSANKILTMSDRTATWREIPCLMPDKVVGNRKNSAVGGGLYYSGIWQELILMESEAACVWAKEIILGN